MVADQDRIGKEVDHLVETFARLGTVPDGIAEIPDSIHFAGVLEDSLERDEIRVDVGDQQYLHCRAWSIRAACISSAEMSAAVIPAMRWASPNVRGRCDSICWRASLRSPGIRAVVGEYLLVGAESRADFPLLPRDECRVFQLVLEPATACPGIAFA